MDKLREQIREILGGECQVRWKEQGYNTLCGHPLPCPKHTDIEKWRLEVISAITKLFKERMLELIGSDKDMSGEFSHDLVYRPPLCDGDKINTEYINYDQRRGYNQALAELRNAINTEGER
jgi:hypothetical protein